MAKLFEELYNHGERNFEPVYLTMDPGYNAMNRQRITDNAELLGVELKSFSSSIFEIAGSDEKSPCYLCARMRRGALYSHARELGCNKIALGHHYDDVIETILMGMLYGGQVQTMMPKLHDINPYTEANIFRSVENVNLSTVIAYKKDGIIHHFLDDYDHQDSR